MDPLGICSLQEGVVPIDIAWVGSVEMETTGRLGWAGLMLEREPLKVAPLSQRVQSSLPRLDMLVIRCTNPLET
jgi:hypothetical protein